MSGTCAVAIFTKVSNVLVTHHKDPTNMWQTQQIIDGNDFWELLDSFIDDQRGGSISPCDKKRIVEAYRDGKLFGLCSNNDSDRELCVKDSGNLLPCFCMVDMIDGITTATGIWTSTLARRRGLARAMVDHLGIMEASHVLPETIPFWEACDVRVLSFAHGIDMYRENNRSMRNKEKQRKQHAFIDNMTINNDEY